MTTEIVNALHWRWYSYGETNRFPESYIVVNRATNRSIYCTSENAALRIIELAFALKTGGKKPFNHKTLEAKAQHLEGISYNVRQFWTWSGKRTLTYETDDHDVLCGVVP